MKDLEQLTNIERAALFLAPDYSPTNKAVLYELYDGEDFEGVFTSLSEISLYLDVPKNVVDDIYENNLDNVHKNLLRYSIF